MLAVGRQSRRGEPRQGPRTRGDRTRMGDPQVRAPRTAARPGTRSRRRARPSQSARSLPIAGAGVGGYAWWRRHAQRSLGERTRRHRAPPDPVGADGAAGHRRRDAQLDLLVKRDDLTGLALGGNKARKLALLGADAIETGRRLSRHRRRSAEQPRAPHRRGRARHRYRLSPRAWRRSARRPRRQPAARRPLRRGPALRWRRPVLRSRGRDHALAAASLRAGGRRPYAIPVGGASTLGVAAYALAIDELRAQLDRDPDWIVVADGSGGTHAGLLAGLGAASPTRVLGVDVGTRPDLDARIPELAADAATSLGRGAPNATVIVDHDHIGDGYGELSAACLDAMRIFARPKGSCSTRCTRGRPRPRCSPRLRDGRIGPDDTVVFWATGGAPALFAHRYQAALTGPVTDAIERAPEGPARFS